MAAQVAMQSRMNAFSSRVSPKRVHAGGIRYSCVRCVSSATSQGNGAPAPELKDAVGAAAISRSTLLKGSIAAFIAASAAAHVGVAHASTDIRKVFVVGATGKTGRRIVQQARAKGYRVVAAVRSISKAQSLGLDTDGVDLVNLDVINASPSEIAAAIGDADAVISALGSGGGGSNPKVIDNEGNKKVVEAAKMARARRFVLVSSLLTNGAAMGQQWNPSFLILNLFGGVLNEKLEAEKFLRGSGLTYTIVRPGGLSDKPAEEVGNVVFGREDTLFGLPGDPGRSISRDTVAAVCVEALAQDNAANRVFEIVASPSAPSLPPTQWFNV